MLEGTANFTLLAFNETKNVDVPPERREPDEPPPRLISRSNAPLLSPGETSSKEDDVPDIQHMSDSESDDDLEDVHLDTLSKEDITEVELSFEDSADAEVQDLRYDPEVM